MTETVVHVTTIEEWKSVLDVWFEQGYSWFLGSEEYNEEFFYKGNNYLLLDYENDILNASRLNRKIIEYSEFMGQQKEDKEMATVYEVSQSVFDELQRIKTHKDMSLIGEITLSAAFIKSTKIGNKAILRYLADDPAIEFKVKDTLYRLSGTDEDDDDVYMTFNCGMPTWTYMKDDAFTATLDEIKKWKTPAWEIEKAD